MDPAGAEVAARFRILLPASWTLLPLAPEGRRERIRRLVRQRVGTADALAAARYRAAAELERAAEAAVRAGVFFSASYDELVEGVPVSASLTVSVTPTGLGTLLSDPAARADDDGRRERLAAVIADRLAARDGDDEDVSSTEIPLGPVVRRRSRAASGARGTDGTELRPTTVQYLSPLSGTDQMLTLSFSTPTLPLADRFAALFDAMARTARLDG